MAGEASGDQFLPYDAEDIYVGDDGGDYDYDYDYSGPAQPGIPPQQPGFPDQPGFGQGTPAGNDYYYDYSGSQPAAGQSQPGRFPGQPFAPPLPGFEPAFGEDGGDYYYEYFDRHIAGGGGQPQFPHPPLQPGFDAADDYEYEVEVVEFPGATQEFISPSGFPDEIAGEFDAGFVPPPPTAGLTFEDDDYVYPTEFVQAPDEFEPALEDEDYEYSPVELFPGQPVAPGGGFVPTAAIEDYDYSNGFVLGQQATAGFVAAGATVVDTPVGPIPETVTGGVVQTPSGPSGQFTGTITGPNGGSMSETVSATPVNSIPPPPGAGGHRPGRPAGPAGATSVPPPQQALNEVDREFFDGGQKVGKTSF